MDLHRASGKTIFLLSQKNYSLDNISKNKKVFIAIKIGCEGRWVSSSLMLYPCLWINTHLCIYIYPLHLFLRFLGRNAQKSGKKLQEVRRAPIGDETDGGNLAVRLKLLTILRAETVY